jgi:ParB family transcriptional regulator, chromosome partitioning protein
MAKRGGLGRNLSVLLSQSSPELEKEEVSSRLTDIPLDSLQPGKYQPRGEIEDVALDELAESIKKQGLLQPLVVREISADRYEIIAGERRWRACRRAGIGGVPVIIKQVDDETAMAMALVENLQREDLNAMDQARAMHRLTSEFDLTHKQVAELLSKSRTAVSNYLRLLQLSDDVKRMLEYGDIEMGHARSLLMLSAEQQSQVAQLIVAKSLSVRETEALVARVKSGAALKEVKSEKSILSSDFVEQLQYLEQQLMTKVKLKPGKNGKGTLVIHYEDENRLQALFQTLKN